MTLADDAADSGPGGQPARRLVAVPPEDEDAGKARAMRYEAAVTSVSWIPSEAATGMMKLPFDVGVAHYDEPPPDVLDDLEGLRAADRFRFANQLRAWVEVDDAGTVTGAGYAGGGIINRTVAYLGKRSIAAFQPVALPDRQAEPEVGDGWVRFVQTTGGRTGAPLPRRVRRAPFVQVSAPIVWTTLSLMIRTDGSNSHEVVGASSFPRHWVYDDGGRLVAKSGLADLKTWMLDAFGDHTPWGDQDSPALVTAVETELERRLSTTIMRGGRKPSIRTLDAEQVLTEQGAPGDELYLLLDGVLRVDVDGEALAELGPGAVVGERAVLEGGRRTATLVAVTACRVAVAAADDLDREALERLAEGHRREDE